MQSSAQCNANPKFHPMSYSKDTSHNTFSATNLLLTCLILFTDFMCYLANAAKTVVERIEQHTYFSSIANLSKSIFLGNKK